ncbi:MAG: hypothetical protein LBE18_06780 [Planctomycetaceae bacterium]|jgi:hypothetical protein|nr:hypothetical protein [Planctomycetaceae bacterium]
MKKNIYLPIIFAYCLSIAAIGCNQPQVPSPLSKEERQKIINSYVEGIKHEAEKNPIEINTAKEINEIELSPKNEHNLRYSILVHQLLFTNQINDAVQVIVKINDTTIKDTCIADIVRHQIKEFNKTNVDEKSPSALESMSAKLSNELHEIINVIEQTNDPLLLTELNIELETTRNTILDKSETSDTLIKLANKIHNDNKIDIIRRVKSIQMIVNYLLNNNQKKQALEICNQLEKIIDTITNPVDIVFVLHNLSALYMLLGSVPDAIRTCETAVPYAGKITTPVEHATAILKIAETFSILQNNFINKREIGKLIQLKKLILSVDPIIARHDIEAENNIKQNVSETNKQNIADKSSTAQSEVYRSSSTDLSWQDIRLKRDKLLRNLVRRQVWLVPESQFSLDDVWSTIHDIEDDTLRDDAIVVAIEMMSITGELEESKDWADFISDKNKKNEIIKKIETKIESATQQQNSIKKIE